MSSKELCRVLPTLMSQGSVIPFLGAGIDHVGRASKADWRQTGRLPDGRELARYLAKRYNYPKRYSYRDGARAAHKYRPELARVAQYVDMMIGEIALRKELHGAFTRTTEPTELHAYLAKQPARARKAGLPNPWPLIVTTNYDDLLELAFDAAKEPFDLLTYFWRRETDPGPVFLHRQHDGEMKPISDPDECENFDFDKRTVILKLHGSVVREDQRTSHFVITEDDYIRYLSKGINNRLPPSLVIKMHECHFLFLGYRLADWNLRAFLFSVWEDSPYQQQSWAIRRSFDKLEASFWLSHGVTLVNDSLESWVSQMRTAKLGSRQPW